MNVGESKKTSCVEPDCTGTIEGIYGGKFYVGNSQIEYTQIQNAKCDRCGFEQDEVFEVWDAENEDFRVSNQILLSTNEPSVDMAMPGLGMRASDIPPEMAEFLKGGLQHSS